MSSDIKEIEQVLYRCCHAVDQGKIDEFVDLFHPEATFVVTWEEKGTHNGHKEIRKWIENYDRVLRSSLKYLRHKITCPVIEVTEDIATAHSYLDVEAAAGDTSQVSVTVGRYQDKLVRHKGHWRIMEKVVIMDNLFTMNA